MSEFELLAGSRLRKSRSGRTTSRQENDKKLLRQVLENL